MRRNVLPCYDDAAFTDSFELRGWFMIDDADCYSNFSQNLVIGIYMIVFGLAIALLGMSYPCI